MMMFKKEAILFILVFMVIGLTYSQDNDIIEVDTVDSFDFSSLKPAQDYPGHKGVNYLIFKDRNAVVRKVARVDSNETDGYNFEMTFDYSPEKYIYARCIMMDDWRHDMNASRPYSGYFLINKESRQIYCVLSDSFLIKMNSLDNSGNTIRGIFKLRYDLYPTKKLDFIEFRHLYKSYYVYNEDNITVSLEKIYVLGINELDGLENYSFDNLMDLFEDKYGAFLGHLIPDVGINDIPLWLFKRYPYK